MKATIKTKELGSPKKPLSAYFTNAPKPLPPVVLGNEFTGTITLPQRRGLTVGEYEALEAITKKQQKAAMLLQVAVNKIAKAKGIEFEEALDLVTSNDPAIISEFINELEPLQEFNGVEVQAEKCLVILQRRLSPDFTMELVQEMDGALLTEIASFVDRERAGVGAEPEAPSPNEPESTQD